MTVSKLSTLLAGAATVLGFMAADGQGQMPLSLAGGSQCDLPPVLDPAGDGLPSAMEVFASEEALGRQVERHRAVVRVASVSYDDMGPVGGEDERWEPFFELHRVLEETYPAVHRFAKVEKINTLGLLYTIQGSDSGLKPVILMAHQDVVPVADETTWRYPPFSAYYDGTRIWGRGASDDKNSLTAIMSAVEELASRGTWRPKRTLLLAFGFDEENSGYAGAQHIAGTLLTRYGPDGAAIILDEGGLGLQREGNVIYALPAVTEKGHVDVWMDLETAGGHSSIPRAHTGIGIAAEMIAALEAHPYEPRVVEGGPTHGHWTCVARWSPGAYPEVTRMMGSGDLRGMAGWLAGRGRGGRYTIQTAQAVDVIEGGAKINAMPERVRIGVNYRVAHHDSVEGVKGNVREYVSAVAEKYGIAVEAFANSTYNDDNSSSSSSMVMKKRSGDEGYSGRLRLTTRQESQPAPVSPMRGAEWDVFAGSIRHSFAFEGVVVPSGEVMTGNTDTRHYQALSKHIYRWTPYRYRGEENIHTVDENVRMDGHMEMVRFYYDFIRNFDAARV